MDGSQSRGKWIGGLVEQKSEKIHLGEAERGPDVETERVEH